MPKLISCIHELLGRTPIRLIVFQIVHQQHSEVISRCHDRRTRSKKHGKETISQDSAHVDKVRGTAMQTKSDHHNGMRTSFGEVKGNVGSVSICNQM